MKFEPFEANEYFLKDDPITLVPKRLKCDYSQHSKDLEIIFEHGYKEYVYIWRSSSGGGLSKLYENKGTVVVYDAYMKTPEPFNVRLHEAARQLSCYLRKQI